MEALNSSVCANVSVDLSESSIRFTTNRHLLVTVATLMCLVAAFIVSSNIFIIYVFVNHRQRSNHVSRINVPGSFSVVRETLLISISFVHMFIAAFCLPLTIVQVVSNGRWTLGFTLCRVKIYADVLSEVVRIYHAVCLTLDSFIMLRFPLRHRMLKSKSGYGLAATVWIIPLALFLLTVSLGWDREDIEDTLECLSQHKTCVTFLSKKVVLIMFPTSTVMLLSILVVLSVLVAIQTHKRGQRRKRKIVKVNLNQSSSWKSSNTLSCVGVQMNSLDSRSTPAPNVISGICNPGNENNVYDNVQLSEASCQSLKNNKSDTSSAIYSLTSAESDTADIGTIANARCSKETLDSVRVTDRSNICLVTSLKPSPEVKAKPNRFKSGVVIVIVVTITHCFYLVSALVCSALLAFNVIIFPLWLMSFLSWLKYVHVSLIPLYLFRNPYFQKIAWPTRTKTHVSKQ
ncbi:5-hydroxytryptamine receptor 5A [Biomphalaria glabrata]|nr:5-hydroxytryptamine receptor 5A-like [Biomphalaria glabrata]